MAIPKTQKAAIKEGYGEATKLVVREIPVVGPTPDEILVKINYSGLCASDHGLIFDVWDNKMQPGTKGIAGHEGAGVVVAVGSNVEHLWKIGDRAGIKWITRVCGLCEYCSLGQEAHCIKQENAAWTVPGTFQEYLATDAHYATRLPDGVKDEDAGPVMCGGVSALVAVKRSGVKAGQWIVITGAGGGCGHFAVQYARALGMRVIAIDNGNDKRDMCLKVGAEHFIDDTLNEDYTEEVKKITTHGAHGIVVFSATKQAFDLGLGLLKPYGTFVTACVPLDATAIAGGDPTFVAMNSLTIVGSVVGTLKDTEEALDFIARGVVKPVLNIGGFEDLDKFCADMKARTLTGRAVVKIAA